MQHSPRRRLVATRLVLTSARQRLVNGALGAAGALATSVEASSGVSGTCAPWHVAAASLAAQGSLRRWPAARGNATSRATATSVSGLLGVCVQPLAAVVCTSALDSSRSWPRQSRGSWRTAPPCRRSSSSCGRKHVSWSGNECRSWPCPLRQASSPWWWAWRHSVLTPGDSTLAFCPRASSARSSSTSQKSERITSLVALWRRCG
mmetsp:Transcript_49038/g.136283  ORF Transcript_49038/g.136283 Transcript_49038/m.136283 type:complete len:205 (-) Transcript_49038:56-670(-)